MSNRENSDLGSGSSTSEVSRSRIIRSEIGRSEIIRSGIIRSEIGRSEIIRSGIIRSGTPIVMAGVSGSSESSSMRDVGETGSSPGERTVTITERGFFTC